MAFGQPSGPPASPRQIDQLAEMLQRAGFSSFREARHPYGLNQRQAAGRFTIAEAEELAERLTAAETVQASSGAAEKPSVAEEPAVAAAPTAPPAARPREERRAQLLEPFGDAVLAAELERRGWCCIPPLGSEE